MSAAPYVIAGAAPYVVAGAAPYVVASAIPHAIASTAPYAFTGAAPYVVASAIPYVFTGAAPYVVASAVPHAIASAAPYVIAGAAAAAGGLAYLLRAALDPRTTLWGEVTWRGPVDEPSRIALTFDDGPVPGPTDRILDQLHALEVPAAFFVIGQYARKHPQLLRRIHDAGHLIGNHSFHHSHLGILRARWYWKRELDDTSKAIADVIGQPPALFRPPMGIRQHHLMHAVRSTGLRVVTWTRSARDGVNTTPERIHQRLIDARPGEILLLHDGIDPYRRRDPAPTLGALGPLIQAYRQRGLRPVRLDELIGRKT